MINAFVGSMSRKKPHQKNYREIDKDDVDDDDGRGASKQHPP